MNGPFWFLVKIEAVSYTHLHVPGTYYDTVLQRVGIIKEDLNELKKWGIMVDRDEEGYLLQIFTKPVEDLSLIHI